MGGPTLFVPTGIAKEARKHISSGAGSSVRQGVELLLKNDLRDDGEHMSGAVDAGSDLQKGLAMLANSPFDALGIDINAGTVDVRKAYKKMALKYHPDKNPSTTPLFQAIQSASEKLSDRGVRRQEASRYKPSKPSPLNKTWSRDPTASASSNANQNQNQSRNQNQNQNNSNQNNYNRQSNNNDNRGNSYESEQEKKRRHEEKKAAWRRKCEEERRAEEERRRRQQQQQQGRRGAQQQQFPGEGGSQARPTYDNDRGRGYNTTFESRQQQAREREQDRRGQASGMGGGGAAGAGKFKGDRTVRKEGMNREAAAAKARMEARRGKAAGGSSPSGVKESPSAAAARAYMDAYAQKQKRENMERFREQRRRQEAAQQQQYQQKPKKSAIPRPTGLSGKVVDRTSVQLEWIKPFYTLATLKVELAYRGAPLLSSGGAPDLSNQAWEVANTLISGDKVRKKNLSLQHCYEFRVRYMVPTPTGRKTQDVGEWAVPVRCILIGEAKSTRPAEAKTRTKYASSSKDKKSSQRSSGYSKYYDHDDYGDNSSYNHHKQHQKQQQPKHQYQYHHHAPDPYTFQEDEEDEVADESFVYEQGKGYRYKDNVNNRADKKQDKKQQQKKKKSALDRADEVDEDPELSDILSQSARMAWKWGGGKGRAGVPEQPEDYYPRRMSRASPPPAEVDEDDYGDKRANAQQGQYDNDTFEEDEVQDEEEAESTSAWYILTPPPTHYKGHYIHTVYSNNNRAFRDNPSISEAKKRMMLTVLGFVSSENYVLVNPPFSRDPSGRAKEEDEWLYCQVHWKKVSPADNIKAKFFKGPKKTQEEEGDELPWGWVKRFHSTRADNHQFLVPAEPEEEEAAAEVEVDEEEEGYDDFNADLGSFTYNRHKDPKVDVWYEQQDDQGNPYFYNSRTGESRWESPEWVEEMDKASGARYFVKLNKDDASPLNSTWSKPRQFSRLVRQNTGHS